MSMLDRIHPPGEKDRLLNRLEKLLGEIYGERTGKDRFSQLVERMEAFLGSLPEERLKAQADFDRNRPYDSLVGKVFAICYPDNVYDDKSYTLETLGEVLSRDFPALGGIHILPERPMSHDDLWPQDLFDLVEPARAAEIVRELQDRGYLDNDRRVTSLWEKEPRGLDDLPPGLAERMDAAYDSHFNDGGFSQKTRAAVDPRFGKAEHIEALCSRYAVMLDYVVNHLDVDSDALERFRRGQSTGEAFVIISPEDYARYRKDGTLAATFRPRPFPLFTGMRKYPGGESRKPGECARLMNRAFEEASLAPLDEEVLLILSIWYKLANDQGLTASDKRIFSRFVAWAEKRGIFLDGIFRDSPLQSGQKALFGPAAEDLGEFAVLLRVGEEHLRVFRQREEEIFGSLFYVYTTFSESQADLNPVSDEGFSMVFDDMFRLMADGDLAMMRMDAIKYLWKEIGKRNFDMDEGNRLIEVIRLVLTLTAPKIRPLDEVNSPDPVVYSMGRDGGFYYLFGQVNAVAAAFNGKSTAPLEHVNRMMEEQRSPDLVLFVMLSTHDGRSVQGLGVDRTDGHVSIRDFYRLKRTVEARGGKPKYRSVARGTLPRDTFDKICDEMGWADFKSDLEGLFREEGETLVLTEQFTRETLLTRIAAGVGTSPGVLIHEEPVNFWMDWTIEGITPYELCCTSRSAFAPEGAETPEKEARRLALAQLYVLTMGQVVPAIYMNDLLGLENDEAGYGRSGRPRDLNRHKSSVEELDFSRDPFPSVYVPLLNRMIEARSRDGAFYPGDQSFAFHSPGETVFLNHAYAGGDHSFVLGNLSGEKAEILLPLDELEGVEPGSLPRLKDLLSGKTFEAEGGELHLVLEGYQGLWLKGEVL